MGWRVSQEGLEHASQWKTGIEPPLSPGQAVTNARKYLKSRGRPSEIPLTGVALMRVGEGLPACFFYRVEFDTDMKFDSDSAGDRQVVVLLDGSIVVPVTSHDGIKYADLSPSDETVVDFMKRAQMVYVFPVKSETAPPPDDKDLRSLDAEARLALLGVLCNPANWHHVTGGAECLAGGVGFLFRKNKDELILSFCSECIGGCRVEGTFGHKSILGWLNECALDSWKQSFAPPETRK